MALEIDLSGRVALVTGGSRGLGRADALTLARAGADVAIADILVESELSEETDSWGALATAARAQGIVHTEETVEEIRALGRRSLAFGATSPTASRSPRRSRRTVEELGSVDILVNNAGTLDHVGQFHDQSPELWERDLRVNLTGGFNCAQAVWPHMKERGWGRIVNMASVAGTLGGFGQASYSTTKSGILGLTKTLAMEGGRHGITCNAIVPGIIGTEAFHMANAGDERADRRAHGVQAPGRAAGHRERDRVPLLRPRGVHHRRRALRVRRDRALRLLSASFSGHPIPPPTANSSRRDAHECCPISDNECAPDLHQIVTAGRGRLASRIRRFDARRITSLRTSQPRSPARSLPAAAIVVGVVVAVAALGDPRRPRVRRLAKRARVRDARSPESTSAG